MYLTKVSITRLVTSLYSRSKPVESFLTARSTKIAGLARSESKVAVRSLSWYEVYHSMPNSDSKEKRVSRNLLPLHMGFTGNGHAHHHTSKMS